MIPRNAIAAYDIELPLSKLIYLFAEKRLDEVPVCKGTLDTFLGMLDAIDFCIYRNEIKEPDDISKLLYKPFFVPETTSLKQLFEEMQQLEEQVAVVVDEYGAISGMIMKKDLIDALFKLEATDTKDQEYTRVSHDVIIANATMPIDELAELFCEKLESEYHPVTLGGYLTEKLGCIPQNGATLHEGNFFFRILQAEPTHIRKIYIQHKTTAENL